MSSKTNERIVVTKDDARIAIIAQRIAEIESRLPPLQITSTDSDSSALKNIKIGVNEFLQDRDAIGSRLAQLGVVGYSTFSGLKAPDQRAVAVSQYLPNETRDYIIRLAGELGFKHYTIFDNVEEEAEEEVLFGSYGGSLRTIARSA
ncbi:hypothetical protein [Pseudoxanthomonas jiangsuensis]|uniref:hypothetical protein n=1 Tax=Pseudoxanthomonas jiangsuensis TaxID=619688 RepID=UPI001391348A|nr:hypothetical protein [Pseudoxanthomonas jiangsuensis]